MQNFSVLLAVLITASSLTFGMKRKEVQNFQTNNTTISKRPIKQLKVETPLESSNGDNSSEEFVNSILQKNVSIVDLIQDFPSENLLDIAKFIYPNLDLKFLDREQLLVCVDLIPAENFSQVDTYLLFNRLEALPLEIIELICLFLLRGKMELFAEERDFTIFQDHLYKNAKSSRNGLHRGDLLNELIRDSNRYIYLYIKNFLYKHKTNYHNYEAIFNRKQIITHITDDFKFLITQKLKKIDLARISLTLKIIINDEKSSAYFRKCQWNAGSLVILLSSIPDTKFIDTKKNKCFRDQCAKILHLALERESWFVIELLLNKGIIFRSSKSNVRYSILLKAPAIIAKQILINHLDINELKKVNLAKENHIPNIDKVQHRNNTIIIIRHLFETTNYDFRDFKNNNLLILAIRFNLISMAKMLIKLGKFNLNHRNNDNENALNFVHYLSGINAVNIADILLGQGIEYLKDTEGCTPLVRALMHENHQLALYFLQKFPLIISKPQEEFSRLIGTTFKIIKWGNTFKCI